jgi:hypothetical protein
MRFVHPPTNLPEWYEPSEPDYPELYQVTFEGMFEVAAGMAVARLLDEETAAPKLPRWPPGKMTQERAEELWPYLFEPAKPGQAALADILAPHERSIVSKYLTRFEAATGKPAPPGKALGYKFRSNDGWLVTPDECRVIADGLDVALAERRDDLVRGLQDRGYSRTLDTVSDLLGWWAQYNRVAADHGGYRVW